MPWLSIAIALLKLAGTIAGWLRDRQMLEAGQQREIAASLARIAHQAGVAGLIEYEVARMTDAEIEAALLADAEDRE